MQFWIHLALVILGVAYFLYSYIKERKLYQLLFVIWIPLTLLTYLSKNKVYLIVLGIVQLIFFFLVIYFLFRNPDKKKENDQSIAENTDVSENGIEQLEDIDELENNDHAETQAAAEDTVLTAEAEAVPEDMPQETDDKEQG